MAQHQELAKEGASLSPDQDVQQLIDLLGLDSDTEGVPPEEVGASLTEHIGQPDKRPKKELSEAPDEGAPALKPACVKAEEVTDAGGPLAEAPVASPAKVKAPLKRGRSFGSSGASPGAKSSRGADEGPIQCGGCSRIRGVSLCFLVPGETCAWNYSDGRGLWCRDCANCYRTNFQTGKGLANFPAWLREDPQHRQRWERT